MTNRIATKSPSKFSHKAIFSKCSKLTHFWDFPIFKTFFFCHFWFPIKKNFFLSYKLTFVSPKKFIPLYHKCSQNSGLFFFGGGGGNGHYSPPSVIYSWGGLGGEANSWGGGPKLGGDLKNFFACGGHSN